MVLSTPAADPQPASSGPDWLARITLSLELARKGVIILVDRAQPARLPDLVRALIQVAPQTQVLDGVAQLRALPRGATLVLLPRLTEADWMNLHRPIFAEEALRVILFCDEETTSHLWRLAPDFFDWISHRVECPPGAPGHAALGVRGAIAARAPGILWDGGPLEATLQQATPGREVRFVRATAPYDTLVREARRADRAWLCWTDIDGPLHLRRVRWALAEAQRRRPSILVRSEPPSPGWWRLHARLEALDQAMVRLAAASAPGRLAALVGLEPEAITLCAQLLQAGRDPEAVISGARDPGGALATEALALGLLSLAPDARSEAGPPLLRALLRTQGASRRTRCQEGWAAALRGDPISLEEAGRLAVCTGISVRAAALRRVSGRAWGLLCERVLRCGPADEAEWLALSEGARDLGDLEVATRWRARAAGLPAQTADAHQVPSAPSEPPATRAAAEETVRRISHAFPDPEYARLAECERLLPDVTVALDLIDRFGLQGPEAARLLLQGGVYQHLRGRYQDARVSLERALQMGGGHAEVATVRRRLAWVLADLGEYGRAAAEAREALRIAEEAKEVAPLVLAESLHCLSWIVLYQGDLQQAEALAQRALSLRTEALGEDHPEVAECLSQLGFLRWRQRRYEEAEALSRRALLIRQGALGADHLHVAWSLHNLALLYASQGRYEDALRLGQRAVVIKEQVLPPDHPSLATTLRVLAQTHRLRGQRGEAVALYQRVLSIRQSALGPSHPSTEESRGELAEAYVNQSGHPTSMTPNQADDVVLCMGPATEEAAAQAIPGAEGLRLRRFTILTPEHGWHRADPVDPARWVEVTLRLREALDALAKASCRRIHVLVHGPYALGALLGNELHERFGRSKECLIYQYDHPDSRWVSWGPFQGQAVSARDQPFLQVRGLEAQPAASDVVVAVSISQALDRGEIERALPDAAAWPWIEARSERIGRDAVRGAADIERAVADLSHLLSEARARHPAGRHHLFYSGPLAILIRAAARLHLFAGELWLYERVGKERLRFVPMLRFPAGQLLHLPSRRALPQRLCFLAIADEWASGRGGISTINRDLCIALSRAGHQVLCALPAATAEEREEAAAAGVALLEQQEPGLSEQARLVLPLPDPGLRPDVVIGHGRVTGDAARVQARRHHPGSLLIHLVHTAPGEIEWFKDGPDPRDVVRRAEERTEEEVRLAAAADLVLGVGPRLTRWMREELHVGRQILSPPIEELLPGLTETTAGVVLPEQVRCLVFGRTEDSRLKGLDLAARAVGALRDRQVELWIRGAPPGEGLSLQRELAALVPPGTRVRVEEYARQRERLERDLRRASVVLMPSRSEGFGLVGLEAISMRVPVLVSDQSGLGEVLQGQPLLAAQHAVVPVLDSIEEDVRVWSERLRLLLGNREAAYRAARELWGDLQPLLSWQKSVAQLLERVRRIAAEARIGEP